MRSMAGVIEAMPHEHKVPKRIERRLKIGMNTHEKSIMGDDLAMLVLFVERKSDEWSNRNDRNR